MPPTTQSGEREYADWLGRVQRRAIMPVKWALGVACLLFWLWPRGFVAPSGYVFSLFFLYFLFLVAEGYFHVFDRITPGQMRPLCYASYVADLAFITLLTHADFVLPVTGLAGKAGSEFYLFYLLMVLRGFALLRTRIETLVAASVVTLLFLGSVLLQARRSDPLELHAIGIRLAFVWTVMFLSIVIVEVLNQQKEEMVRARERLVRSESLAQIGVLAAGIAHEINNPIGIISTYCEYLKRLPDMPHADDIEQIQREARRCEGIVRQLLEFANPNVRRFEPVDMRDLLGELRDFVMLDRQSPIPVTVEAAAGVPPVLGDRGQLKQALLNCLVNARQVLAERNMPSPAVTLRLEQGLGGAVVLVEDNGPGIAPEDVERVFDPFFSRREGGTGLGLSITRRIVEAHSGTITIARRPEGGTVVRILLPAAPGA